MAKYKYVALGSDGIKRKGTATAASKDAAKDLIVKKGLKPISLTGASKFSLNTQIGEPKVKSKDKVVFTRQLATMINAGVALTRALSTLEKQTESKALKLILPGIIKDVESGKTLTESIAKYPKTFDSIYVNMIKAGEAGGILDDIMERLAIQQEKDAQI